MRAGRPQDAGPGRPPRPSAPGHAQRGAAMITVLVALLALLAAGALAVDAGLLWSARAQMQGVADSAALTAAGEMIDNTGPSVTLGSARTKAQDVADDHSAVSASSVSIRSSDMSFGLWDLSTRTLDTSVDLTDPDQVTGVRVLARLDSVSNGPVPAFLSRVIGATDFAVMAAATGYLGYAGASGPGTVDLPIGIDCCEIAGPSCEQDYCDTITNNPPNYGDYATDANGSSNPCFLDGGTTPATCLDFYATGNQVACWTAFDESSPSVNTSGLNAIVSSGNSTEVSVEDAYYVDNGTKAPVVGDIRDRFYGEGSFTGNPAGEDTNGDGLIDSWVVGLPVVECQSSDNCGGGSPAAIEGFVCFEIQEVVAAPEKRIKGRFLCPNDPLFDKCDLGLTKTGGKNFGVRADIPVLVQ